MVAVGSGLALVAVAIIVVLRIRPAYAGRRKYGTSGGLGSGRSGHMSSIGSSLGVGGSGTLSGGSHSGVRYSPGTHIPLSQRDLDECIDLEEKDPDVIPTNKGISKLQKAFLSCV